MFVKRSFSVNFYTNENSWLMDFGWDLSDFRLWGYSYGEKIYLLHELYL